MSTHTLLRRHLAALPFLAYLCSAVGCPAGIPTIVLSTPPAVSLIEPADGAMFEDGETIAFRVRVGDEDPSQAIDELIVTIQSGAQGQLWDGSPDTRGDLAAPLSTLTVGLHDIVIVATDDDGLQGQASLTIEVIETTQNPLVEIIRPTPGAPLLAEEELHFEGRALDEQQDADTLQLSWASSLDGVLSETSTDRWGVTSFHHPLSVGSHIISLQATDEDGNIGETEVEIEVRDPDGVDGDGDGFTENSGDCDDTDATIHPGATELPNGVDEDCDGEVDEDTVFSDDDGDGHSELDGDCNDADASVGPHADELPNGLDDDCDGEVDEGTTAIDRDGDGYCEATSCTDGSAPGDCDDTNSTVFPGALEILNGLDDDCDGEVDEGTTAFDDDGDGFTEVEGDCDDADPTTFPGAWEACDGRDNDCDGTLDEESLGEAEACPGSDCLSIHDVRSDAPDGVYWIDPDSGGVPFQARCDMSTNGGGWTLAGKISNQDEQNWSHERVAWTEVDAYGDATTFGEQDARSEAWGRVTADDFMLTDSGNPGEYLATTSTCLRGYTPAHYFTLALADFPYTEEGYFDTCAITWTWWPNWATEPDYNGFVAGSEQISLTNDYLVIARTDFEDTSGVVSFYQTWLAEADLGLGALEDNEFSGPLALDVGGPTSCAYNEIECAEEYPETVFFWVR